MIEIEFKFPVDSLAAVREQCLQIGAISSGTSQQSDEYINDPLRDFAKQDKALRIRDDNGSPCLTFKGPNLDPAAKIRQEVEMPLVDNAAAEQIKEVFLGIGFYSVAKVVKQRETLELNWQDTVVHVCLDDVEEVGGFVELELVVQDDGNVDEAKNRLNSLADELGLSGSIRTSYLELLLKNRGEI
ncbi:MAG: class IV adenylate cyclase [Mariniblastus sp.]